MMGQRVVTFGFDESEGPVDEVGGDEAVASEDGPDGTDAPDEADDASAEDVEE